MNEGKRGKKSTLVVLVFQDDFLDSSSCLCVYTQLFGVDFCCFSFLLSASIHPQKHTNVMMSILGRCLAYWKKGEMKLCFRAIGVFTSLFTPGIACLYVRKKHFFGELLTKPRLSSLCFILFSNLRWKCRLLNALQIYFLCICFLFYSIFSPFDFCL